MAGLKIDRDNANDAVSIYASDEEVSSAVEENETVYFKVRFNFVNGHKGFRPGEFHLFFGTAGSGKTTLMRAIMSDCAVNQRVLLWQSEENRRDLMITTAKQNLSPEIRKNISIISESDMKPELLGSVKAYQAYYEKQITLIKPGIVIFDNLTTSVIYESLNPTQQFMFFNWIQKFHKKIKIPILAVGHTKAGVFDGQPHLVDLDDIRGSKSIPNGSPYVYIFQRFKVGGDYFAFIRVRKSRFHQHEGVFHLTYDKNKNTYLGDAKINFEEFKLNFNKRERLT